MRRRWRRLAITSAIVVMTLVGVGAALAGGSSNKPYSAFISAPPSAAATTTQATTSVGGTSAVGIRLRNDTKTQRLGSANITLPAGAAVQAGSVVLVTPSGGSATVAGNVIKLRDLSVAPGDSAFVRFAAVVPCTATGSSYQFALAAKQSNDFNGTGNDLTLVTPKPVLAAIGSCVPCPSGLCTASTSTGASTASVSGLATTGDRIRVSLGAPDAPAVDCSGYTETTETVAFDLTNSVGGSAGGLKTVKLQIKNPTKAANLYKICFQGGDASPPVILPACKCAKNGVPTNVPCAQPAELKKGVVTLTAITPAGDPWIKG
ncbi:MAG TPA: hypothetical protein PKD59_06610 [Miltoncostaeaceae bacterium]|nr:hypothetical protein [Miltoncostaeaceae bacterium]